MTSVVYHYTWSEWLRSIMSEGIRTSPHDSKLLGVGEHPLVWCSIAPQWEPMAHPHNDARVVLPAYVAPLNWFAATQWANMPEGLARAEVTSALLCGSNVLQWRFAVARIPPSVFLGVEVYDERLKTWRPW